MTWTYQLNSFIKTNNIILFIDSKFCDDSSYALQHDLNSIYISDHQCSSSLQPGLSVSESGQETWSWDWRPSCHPSVIRAQPLAWSLDTSSMVPWICFPWFFGPILELVTLCITREIPSVLSLYRRQDLKAKRQHERYLSNI